MSLEDLFCITTAFAEWPFKPEVLHDFYAEREPTIADSAKKRDLKPN